MILELRSALICLSGLISLVAGHGFVQDPAARQVCYRSNKKCTAVHWTPDELNCGGFSIQNDQNGGKCGVCGDAYHLKNPAFIYPGKYAKGVITKVYREGQQIDVTLRITTNHLGWSEFRVGDIGTPPITQNKLTHLLKLTSGGTRWKHGRKSGTYTVRLQLPRGLICKHCVMQWWWKVGNSWGCDNEGCGLGHGKQETFVNCVDISITPSGGPLPTDEPPPPPPTHAPPPPPTQAPPPPTQAPPPPPTQAPPLPPTQAPPPPPSDRCKAIGAWAGNEAMNKWCNLNCDAGYCPPSICICN